MRFYLIIHKFINSNKNKKNNLNIIFSQKEASLKTLQVPNEENPHICDYD